MADKMPEADLSLGVLPPRRRALLEIIPERTINSLVFSRDAR